MFPVSVLLAHPSNRLWPIRAKPIGLAPRRPGIADKQQPNTKGDHHDARKSFLPSQDARLPRAPSGQFRWKPRPLAPNTSASILSLRIATDRTGSLTTTRFARLPEPLTEVSCPIPGHHSPAPFKHQPCGRRRLHPGCSRSLQPCWMSLSQYSSLPPSAAGRGCCFGRA
jgi:hypothetical protein